jgi:ribokinase
MITVFGSINMDLIATTAELPKPGETVPGSSFSTAAGGKGANQALAATRAGARVRMAGAVGNDAFAEPALALLKDAGTDLSPVLSASEPTGTALILVGDDGENMITVIPGANGTLTADEAVKAVDAMSPGDLLLLQLEIPAAAVEAALRAARDKGVTSVLSTAPYTADAARLAEVADIVIANETEFEDLAGCSSATAADRSDTLRRLHADREQTFVVTLGAEGVVAIRNREILSAPGLVIEPVDTVGAGDTFCGYLAAGLDQGLDFAQALRRAAVAGSLACLTRGAQPSIPFAKAVDQAL